MKMLLYMKSNIILISKELLIVPINLDIRYSKVRDTKQELPKNFSTLRSNIIGV